MLRRLCSFAVGFVLVGSALVAQDQTATGTASSSNTAESVVGLNSGKLIFPVLVFDRARVLSSSQIGRDLDTQVAEQRAALLAENEEIYADLEAEEQELAEIRGSLSEEAFRARAQAFDDKVVKVRAAQDAKAEDIQTLYEEGLAGIEQEMNSVLTGIARDFSAVLMFERSQVYLMSGAIDVSQIAIDRLDARRAEQAAPADTATTPQGDE